MHIGGCMYKIHTKMKSRNTDFRFYLKKQIKWVRGCVCAYVYKKTTPIYINKRHISKYKQKSFSLVEKNGNRADCIIFA